MFFRNRKVVPALMFHSVGLEQHPWIWNHISESVQSFYRKIERLSQEGFTCITWDDLYEYMKGNRSLSKDSILLTFDDGYLDNWVYVYPILKRFKMKGTIFVNPDFVDPTSEDRPNIESVWSGDIGEEDLNVAGFLSWREMREMEDSGCIDIQSHALTHTWYFKGPKVIDFHRPSDVPQYPWLFWNARPERKPKYLVEDQQEFISWGTPIFEHEKALVAKRFFPSEEAVEEICGFVRKYDGREFFELPDWRQKLVNRFPILSTDNDFPGSYESSEQQRSRIFQELEVSKRLIEGHLRKTVDYICWPGGGNSAMVRDIASEVGYRSFTLSSRDVTDKRNVPGSDAGNIKRIPTSNQIRIKGKAVGEGGALFQLLGIYAHQGGVWRKLMFKGYKLVALLRSWLSAR